MTVVARPKLLFFVNEDWYFCLHRMPFALAARDAGFDVAVLARELAHGDVIRNAGLRLIPLALERRSRNPATELATLREVIALYRAERPDLVQHVTVKPILYGSIAARLAGISRVVNTFAGLGYLFISSDTGARVLRPVVEALFRWALRRTRVIVENSDDRAFLAGQAIADAAQISVVGGTGVDCADFAPQPFLDGAPLTVLPSRLLWDKGVGEFVAAARTLRGQGVKARFALVGDTDPGNPSAIPRATLEQWAHEGVVEWWGWRDDMQEVLRQAHIVCLPSYREGLPRALLEAGATGRPVVTTDAPGCREIVRDGDNGLLVPVRNAPALADALKRLIDDPALRAKMGARGRARVEREFSVERIVGETLAIYRELLDADIQGGAAPARTPG